MKYRVIFKDIETDQETRRILCANMITAIKNLAQYADRYAIGHIERI